jgi:hypothetical protein
MSDVNPDHWAGCECSQCVFDVAVGSYKTAKLAERDAPTIGEIMTAPASPACPLCGSTDVREIVAYDKPGLECRRCNHWGTLEWGFEQPPSPRAAADSVRIDR